MCTFARERERRRIYETLAGSASKRRPLNRAAVPTRATHHSQTSLHRQFGVSVAVSFFYYYFWEIWRFEFFPNFSSFSLFFSPPLIWTFPSYLKRILALECDRDQRIFYVVDFIWIFIYFFMFNFFSIFRIILNSPLYILWRISPPFKRWRSCYGLRDFPYQTSTWSSRLKDYSAISNYCRDARNLRWSSMQVGEPLLSLPPSLNLSLHLSLTIRPFPPPIFLLLTPVSP